ncbi:disulfide bond formation protein B [Phenylobacterium sp. J367]|uniref:disulfide bond formation protein B n=1 Tax=Phenylobacterium sp. J367 TaxID=2898435 RepID=UPI002150FA2E|nr:disulfide bond formation protein B [Phenylobacterium sp. J367]MCR5877323.1 disulfide bond formation protein B [Phenylobacterium sp. J367]
MLKPFLDRWRLVALLASAGMLAIAHAFETFGGYAPCTLCLRQREVYWTAIGLAVGFMVLVRLPGGPRWRELTCWVLGLVFLVGVGVAAYHAGAEWKFWPGPTTCASAGGGITAADMEAFLGGEEVRPPACDEAAWVFAGLSMAGWNVLISLGLAGLSVLAALHERAKR